MVDSGEVFASYNFYISLIVLYFAGSIASAGGIGGGGVNVPLLLVLGGFDYKDAVVFSLCTVLGNHLAQSYINWPISHPYVKQRPLIYWDLILFLLPTQLGGSNLGVIISDAPPELLLLICAFLILALAIAKTYYKFMSYYHEESKGEAKSKYQKLVHYANECETHSRSQSLQSGCTSKYSIDESNSALLSSIAVEEGNKSGFQVPLLSTIPEDPAETSILSANDFDFTVTLASNNPPENPNEDFAEVNPMARSSGGGNSSTTMSEDILISAVNPTHLPNTTTALISEPPRTYSTSSNALVFRILPTTILGILAGVFMVYVAFFLLLQYTVQSCSAEYYAVLGSLYPFLLYFIYWARGYARNRQKHDAYQFLVKGDVDMEEQSIVLILLIFLVGVLSALLGIFFSLYCFFCLSSDDVIQVSEVVSSWDLSSSAITSYPLYPPPLPL